MGYTSDTSTSLKDSNNTHDKIDTEVVLKSSKSCCKNCERTKYIWVVQGLFNVSLIVLMIVLFLSLNKLKVNTNENSQQARTIHINTPSNKQYSVGDKLLNDTGDLTTMTSTSTPKVTDKPEPKLLTKLQTLDKEVPPKLVGFC